MKTVLLILSFFLVFTLQAQLERGNKLVGLQTNLIPGDIFSTYPTLAIGSSNTTYGLNLVPTMGVAIQRNWLIGGQATVGFLREKGPSGYYNDNTYYDLGIAPFTRLYLDLSRAGKMKFFGMASAELAYTSSSLRYSDNVGPVFTSKYSQVNLRGSLGIGFAYFGQKTSVDLNASVAGLRLGVYKIIRAKK